MMNHLNSVKIAWDNIISVHISIFYGQTESFGWSTKPFCRKMMEYKNCFYVQDGDMKSYLIVRNYTPAW